ncbi:transposase [Pyxidicoccus caerfyrddinensis]|uniref:transposase n=1 Tax=Pyxidicoccus caerfyrddinensis TaxID=2709663 RepID=UPI0013DC9597|nr:transposase [Pyxidicoccus caerfyrddinensis]
MLFDVLTLLLGVLRSPCIVERHGGRASVVGKVRAVLLIRFFGSNLQVTPHFHPLVPDGVFAPDEDGVRVETLLPLTQRI